VAQPSPEARKRGRLVAGQSRRKAGTMKSQIDHARTLAWTRANAQRASGRIVRSKAWGGKPSVKQSRQAWRQRGER
jgi:hypothetical protein